MQQQVRKVIEVGHTGTQGMGRTPRKKNGTPFEAFCNANILGKRGLLIHV